MLSLASMSAAESFFQCSPVVLALLNAKCLLTSEFAFCIGENINGDL